MQGNPFYVAPMLGLSDPAGAFERGRQGAQRQALFTQQQELLQQQQAQAQQMAADRAALSAAPDMETKYQILSRNPDLLEEYRNQAEFFSDESKKLHLSAGQGLLNASSLDDAVRIQQEKLRTMKQIPGLDTSNSERQLQRMLDGGMTLEDVKSEAKLELLAHPEGQEYLNNLQKSQELAGNHDLIQLTNARNRIAAQNPNSPLLATYDKAIESAISQTGNTPAGLQEFATLISGLSAEEQENAKRIKLGLVPRAVGKADHVVNVGDVPHMVSYDSQGNPSMSPITLSTGEQVTPESVADSRGTVASGKKAGELAQQQSAELASQARTVQSSLPLYDQAIAALDAGANSGPIINRLTPTIEAETLKLENLKSELGLKLIAGANFGQLNASELELALSTVIPDLPAPQLRDWLAAKKVAQQKMADQLEDAAIFLGTPGNTPAKYMKMLRDQDAQAAAGGVDDELAALVNQYAD